MLRAAPAGLGAFGIGDARDRERRLLGGARPLDQHLGAGLLGVEHVEARPVAGDFGGVGDAAIGVLGDRAGHRDRALDELVERLRRAVGRGDHRLLPADEHPEPQILAFRALELLGLAEAPGMGQRDALEQHRIGGIGAGAPRAPDQILQQVERCPASLSISGQSSLIPGVRNSTMRR